MAITLKPHRAKLRMCPKCNVTVGEEIAALNVAMRYLATADKESRERFMYHITHRFFPEGAFHPVNYRIATNFDFTDSLKRSIAP